MAAQYLYEDRLNETSSRAPQPSLKASDLTVMSSEWVAQLRQAAIQVDADQIFQLIEQIPTVHSALAEGLIDLAHHFGFDEIIELTHRKDENP